jgi:WD40 repeat protein/tRNA A-37 threonylcarbamoyl transferase component Bud32
MSADDTMINLLMQAEEWQEQGRRFDVETLCPNRPDLWPTLRHLLAGLGQVDQALHVKDSQEGITGIRAPRTLPHGASPPTTFPGYEIVGEIGRGGMGVVYKARQAGLNRDVALKVVLAGSHAGPNERARFRREAEAVARLSHPNIVQVHEVGEHDGVPFLCLEYVHGPSLAAWAGGRPQPPRHAAALVQTLARAVHAAHAQGIIHRDLTPGNVLLQIADSRLAIADCSDKSAIANLESAIPKITDFGLAKLLDADPKGASRAYQTKSGAILGTAPYLPPEQASTRAGEVGPLSDVYSLGAVLYELLTGRPPFLGATTLDTLTQVLSAEPVPPRRLQPKVPRDLETICLKCLEKQPVHRYGNAQALADDLARFGRREPIRARPVGAAGRAVRWARRRPATAALLVVSVLATLALVGALVNYFNGRKLVAAYQAEATAHQQAEDARQDAETHRQEAEAAEARAEQARAAEAAARRREQVASARAEALHDVHRIGLAHAAWREGNAAQADRLLGEVPEAARCWEWRYLHRICHLERFVTRGQFRPSRDVAFSPDGKRLASVAFDGTLKVWDSASGQELLSVSVLTPPYPGSPALVTGVAFSPDGKLLATSSNDGTVKVWEAATGKERRSLAGSAAPVQGVAFSPDGKLLAAAGGTVNAPGEVRLWEVDTGKEVQTLKGHLRAAVAVAFGPDGKWLVSVGWDKVVRRFDLADGHEMLALRDAGIRMALAPDGRLVAACLDDGVVRLWDLATGRETAALRGGTGGTTALAFSPDSKLLATANRTGAVGLWLVATGYQVLGVSGNGKGINALAFSPDGRLLAGAGDDGVHVWDPSAWREPFAFRPQSDGPMPVTGVQSATLDPEGRRLLLGCFDGALRVCDAASGQHLLTLRGHSGAIRSVAWSRDGRLLASGGQDGIVKLWDPAAGQELHALHGHTGQVNGVALSADGRLLASVAADGGRVWDTATGQQTVTLQGQTGEMGCVVFRPDGQLLATGSLNRTVRLWDATTGRETRPALPQPGVVTRLAFSPEGTRLAAAQGAIRLLDLATAEALVLTGHDRLVRHLAFSPDGRRLASVGDDLTVRLWDVAVGVEVFTLGRSNSTPNAVAFTTDGRRLLAIDLQGFVRVWDADGPSARHP